MMPLSLVLGARDGEPCTKDRPNVRRSPPRSVSQGTGQRWSITAKFETEARR